jgi:hypothetical protein
VPVEEATDKDRDLSKLANKAISKGHPVKKLPAGRAEYSTLPKGMAKGVNLERGRWSGHGSFSEEQIDEISAGLAQRAGHHAFVKSDKMKKDAQKEPDMHSYVQAVHRASEKNKQGIKFIKYAAKKMEEETISEKHLTPAEKSKKEEIVKSMKKGLSGFKERYGKRAKAVMYATATKQAEKIAEEKKDTVLVSPKGYKGGGQVTRIPKKEYDPKKHNLASE